MNSEQSTSSVKTSAAPHGSKSFAWFWIACAVLVGSGLAGKFTNGDGQQAVSTVGVPHAGFVTTMQEIMACDTSSNLGQVGALWREGKREETDYYARKHCIIIPKGQRVLLIQGGFTSGLLGTQELEVEYLGLTRRLFTSTGDGLFRKD